MNPNYHFNLLSKNSIILSFTQNYYSFLKNENHYLILLLSIIVSQSYIIKTIIIIFNRLIDLNPPHYGFMNS